jgi:hypothetical protein
VAWRDEVQLKVSVHHPLKHLPTGLDAKLITDSLPNNDLPISSNPM